MTEYDGSAASVRAWMASPAPARALDRTAKSLPASGVPDIGTGFTDYRPLRVYRFIASGDNYEPCPRTEHTGTVSEYVRHDGSTAYVIADTDIPNATRCAWLLDMPTGEVIACYTAGWRYADDGTSHYARTLTRNTDAEVSEVYAFPMAHGKPRDASGYAWRIGPKRAYHLILTRTDSAQGE